MMALKARWSLVAPLPEEPQVTALPPGQPVQPRSGHISTWLCSEHPHPELSCTARQRSHHFHCRQSLGRDVNLQAKIQVILNPLQQRTLAHGVSSQ